MFSIIKYGNQRAFVIKLFVITIMLCYYQHALGGNIRNVIKPIFYYQNALSLPACFALVKTVFCLFFFSIVFQYGIYHTVVVKVFWHLPFIPIIKNFFSKTKIIENPKVKWFKESEKCIQ